MNRRGLLLNFAWVLGFTGTIGPAWAAELKRSGLPLGKAFERRLQPCLEKWLLDNPLTGLGPWRFFLGQTPQQPPTSCYFYDPLGQRLVLWELHTGDEYMDLRHSRRQWDLTRDVMEDIGGSTYLLQTQEAAAIKACCLRGRMVEL